jgi:hypothetical protein
VADLHDVQVTTPTDGQVLRYDSGVFENDTLDAGDVGAIPTTEKGAANGVASLGATSRVLQSSVDNRFGFDLLPNFYYANFGVGVQQATRGNGTLFYFPFTVSKQGNIDRIGTGINLAGSAGSVIRLGIYASDDFGQPSTLLLDAGTIDGTATGVGEITISPALTLPIGRYFFAICQQGAPATNSRLYLSQSYKDPLIRVQNNSDATGTLYVGYFQSGVTGAFPASVGVVNVTPLSIYIIVRAS